ncbi:MAG: response regulator [Candidatus Omnitrophota bacterium]|nr:response regulator [Candidatus Omnitrophota bacterium]MBU1929033.1 response regulator [Candidatus Omnitrophota bacterium]MBU2035274.1 response regulator [Candidatus Omnitrophota bacterium]MBU2257675.1 response regulator [Candidatus Omnitrophota bacterium]
MDKKILVVDDEPENIILISSRLKAHKYQTISAPDGESCIGKAIQEKPDLIILDIVMPGLSGFEVARQLKKDERTKKIPIIMLTALAQGKDLIDGLEAGAVCFISKPFNPADLIFEVEQALGSN